MPFSQGIYFRVLDNQTDPTDYDAEISLGNNYPRVSAQGVNVGWEVAMGQGIDRNTTTDVRLKAIHFSLRSNTCDYRIDLPSAGVYYVRAAMGDSGFSHPQRLRIVDTTTVLLDSDSAADIPSDQWMDANEVTRTSESDWVNNNTLVQLTFATTICRFRFGPTTFSGGDANMTVNTIFISDQSPGTTITGLGRKHQGFIYARPYL
jgi:hypothetical protein